METRISWGLRGPLIARLSKERDEGKSLRKRVERVVELLSAAIPLAKEFACIAWRFGGTYHIPCIVQGGHRLQGKQEKKSQEA